MYVNCGLTAFRGAKLRIFFQFPPLLRLHFLPAHPRRDVLAHALLEGEAEGAVAAVAAHEGQLLDDDGTLGGDGLTVEPYEMADAQVVDVGVVGRLLPHEIQAEVGSVGANGLGHLRLVQVVLQVEPGADAVLLQQERYLLVGVVGKRVGRRAAALRSLRSRGAVGLCRLCVSSRRRAVGLPAVAVDGQLRQRLHAPQQEDEEHELDEVQDEQQGDAAVDECMEDEQQQEDDRQHVALPHLLALQVGIVVAQPAAVLPDGEGHIKHEERVEQQDVGRGRLQEPVAGADEQRHAQRHERYRGHEGGPYGAPAVLEHGQQHAGDGGLQRHEVERDSRHVARRVEQVAHGVAVGGGDIDKIPPHVAQCRHAEERRSPVAQPHRRRDLGREGIAAPQQQVERGDERHRSRHAIDDEKQYHPCNICMFE